MTSSAINTLTSTDVLSLAEQSDDALDFDDAQSISGRNIDPKKLAMLLRVKFGAGAYDIHVSTLQTTRDKPHEWEHELTGIADNAELVLYHRSAKVVNSESRFPPGILKADTIQGEIAKCRRR